MDKNTFSAIVDKVNVLKDKASKASGAIESIQQEWAANDWGTTREATEKTADAIKEEMKENDEMIEGLYAELNGLTAWQFV